MSNYKLRPHHGLCLNFFCGNGYSEGFVENMTNIVNTLAQNPKIELTNKADNVCNSCPNRTGEGGCETYDKVKRYDEAVLSMCELHIGDKIHWDDFHKKVRENILDKSLLEKVCGDCCWFYICGK